MKKWIFRISILSSLPLFTLCACNSLNSHGNLNSTVTSLSKEIPQGRFTYELYFSEFGGRVDNAKCDIIIEGNKIKIEQNENSNLPGEKTILNGILLKHKSGRWIIGQNQEDKNADEIGGCSDGPTPIDFESKIIEWC